MKNHSKRLTALMLALIIRMVRYIIYIAQNYPNIVEVIFLY